MLLDFQAGERVKLCVMIARFYDSYGFQSLGKLASMIRKRRNCEENVFILCKDSQSDNRLENNCLSMDGAKKIMAEPLLDNVLSCPRGNFERIKSFSRISSGFGTAEYRRITVFF